MSSVTEADLRAQESRLLTAMLQNDATVLSSLFDREYVFTSAGGAVWDRDKALQDFADPTYSVGKLDVELERVIPLTDAGVVVGRSRVAGRVRGVSVSGVYRFTRVWRRNGDRWTILATHTSVAEPPADEVGGSRSCRTRG